MTIVLCGGGSGGHITPLLAVARELRSKDKTTRIVYLGEKRGKFSHIAEDSGLFDACHYVSAGKLRRYHNEPFLKRITDFKTIFFNIRDVFRLLAGTIQSMVLFLRLRPNSVLLKGGYVCVPASIGARLSGAYIVTHDSDALPGLSNRFAARFAAINATAMPAKYYNYHPSRVKHVGLPVDSRYRSYSSDEVRFLREKFGIPPKSKVVLITGGSNGARRLNEWSIEAIDKLQKTHSDLYAIMIVGKGNATKLKKQLSSSELSGRLQIMEFSSELYHLAAVSDVIITRAGATTIAEFAAGSKACILVPNPDLTGGHQLKNAKVYIDQKSVLAVQENKLVGSVDPLVEAVDSLLENEDLRTELGRNLNATLLSVPAAKALAEILYDGALPR